MSFQRSFLLNLADALLRDPWTLEQLRSRLSVTLGYSQRQQIPPWAAQFLVKIHAHFIEQYPLIKRAELAQFMADEPVFQRAWTEYKAQLRIRNYPLQCSMPQPPRLNCPVMPFDTPVKLATWLGLSIRQLDSYTRQWRPEAATEIQVRQQHYHYQWQPKASGGQRLLSIPKSRLRAVQRQIHQGILNHIPLHTACHGFRRGHSCLTYAAPHAGQRIVIRMDLQTFFTSIPYRRIHALYTSIGYSSVIARQLALLCTHRVPLSELASQPHLSWHQRKRLMQPHLPQGAPSSPALANLCAFALDRRLAALATKMGATYTRYADDLAFSGGEQLEAAADRLHVLIGHIVQDEGFTLNMRKTRVMRQGVKQQLTGIVLNRHVNYPRKQYDELKATLYNAIRNGPESQNRQQHDDFRAHLLGRIAHVQSLNPQRAKCLGQLFEQIQWNP